WLCGQCGGDIGGLALCTQVHLGLSQRGAQSSRNQPAGQDVTNFHDQDSRKRGSRAVRLLFHFDYTDLAGIEAWRRVTKWLKANKYKIVQKRDRKPSGFYMNSPCPISVRGLRKTYASLEAVKGIDFEVAPGEVFGLLGPNGAGKTTIVEILEGLRPRTAGDV